VCCGNPQCNADRRSSAQAKQVHKFTFCRWHWRRACTVSSCSRLARVTSSVDFTPGLTKRDRQSAERGDPHVSLKMHCCGTDPFANVEISDSTPKYPTTPTCYEVHRSVNRQANPGFPRMVNHGLFASDGESVQPGLGVSVWSDSLVSQPLRNMGDASHRRPISMTKNSVFFLSGQAGCKSFWKR